MSYIYSVLLRVSNVNIMLSFIQLALYEERLENIYDVTLFTGKLTRPILGKCIVLDACDEMKVQKFVTFLSAVVPVIQYFKL